MKQCPRCLNPFTLSTSSNNRSLERSVSRLTSRLLKSNRHIPLTLWWQRYQNRRCSHVYSPRPCVWAVWHDGSCCCCAFSTFDRLPIVTSTPQMPQIGQSQSSLLHSWRQFIWFMITSWDTTIQVIEPIYFTQLFPNKNKVWLQCNSTLQQYFSRWRRKMRRKIRHTILQKKLNFFANCPSFNPVWNFQILSSTTMYVHGRVFSIWN